MVRCVHCSTELNDTGITGGEAILHSCPACFNPLLLRSKENGLVSEGLEGFRDIRQLAKTGSVMQGVLDAVATKAVELPVFPEVPLRILSLINDPLSSTKEIADIVRQDQGIAVRVLRVANSAYYTTISEVTDVTTACARLGLKGVANIVLASSVKALHQSANPVASEAMHDQWRHSLAAAFCAEKLGDLIGEENKSMFSAGLLHDIGKTVLVHLLFRGYSGRTGAILENPKLLRQVLKTYHGYVGLYSAVQWKLSGGIRAAILFHEGDVPVPDPQWVRPSHAMILANLLAYLVEPIDDTEAPPTLVDHPSVRFFGLSAPQLHTAFSAARRDLNEMMEAYATV